MGTSYGQIAYEGYCARTGWKSLATGAQLPQWEDQKDGIREAWEAAANAVLLERAQRFEQS